MKKQDKLMALKVIFTLLFMFVVYLLIFYNITIGEETALFWSKQHDFATRLVTNISDNLTLYIALVGVLVGLYYFLVYRPKVSNRRITRR